MRIGIYAASAAVLLSLAAAATVSRAEPMLTSGIGLASCAKLGADLKPGAGLDHAPNALLFYWTQGYVSAANFFLLNKYADYIDLGAVMEPAITQLVLDFCKANPDKKPISAIDKFIRETKKVAAKKSDAIDLWEHKPTLAKPTLAATTDDVKWIDQCVKDNKDQEDPRRGASCVRPRGRVEIIPEVRGDDNNSLFDGGAPPLNAALCVSIAPGAFAHPTAAGVQ